MSTVTPALLLSVLAAVFWSAWTANPRPCRMKTWDVQYTDIRVLHPMGMPCYEFCRRALGEPCLYTHSVLEGDLVTCHAYVTENAPLQKLSLSIKLCHPFMHTCGTFTCNPCFPCHEVAFEEPYTYKDCGVMPVRLRCSDMETLGHTDLESCSRRCLQEPDCLWAEHKGDNCQLHRLSRAATSAHDVNVTLKDFRCS